MSLKSEHWDKKFYLLTEDVKGEVKSKSSKIFPNNSQTWQASKGIFLEENSDDQQPSNKNKLFLRSIDNPQNTVTVNISQVFKLSEVYYLLMLAVPNRTDRVGILNEPGKLRQGKSAQTGDLVQVETNNGVFEARIKYKGLVMWEKGIFFGVEFERKVGNCDGKPHFECEDQYGSFVALHDIHFVNKHEKTQPSNNKTSNENNRRQFISTSNYNGMKIGTKVLCFISGYQDPLKGSIVYIGTKESNTDPVAIGVQLSEKPSKPIKNGNFYNGCKLFECPDGLGYITTDMNSLHVVEGDEGYVMISNKKENLSASGYDVDYLPSNEKNPSRFLSKDEINLKKQDYQQNQNVLSKKGLSMQEIEMKSYITSNLPQDNMQNFKINNSTYTGSMGIEKSSEVNNFSNKLDYKQSENLKLHEANARFRNDLNDEELYPGDEELYPTDEELYPTGSEEKKLSSQEIQVLDKYFKTNSGDVFIILAERLFPAWLTFGKLLGINDKYLDYLNHQQFTLKEKLFKILNEWARNNSDKGWSHLRNLLLHHNEEELVKTCEMKLNGLKQKSSLQINDMVEFQVSGTTFYGVLKWRGFDLKIKDELAGIELEESSSYLGTSDGTFHGERYFICSNYRGYFIKLSKCKPDNRFQNLDMPISVNINSGKLIPGYHQPISKLECKYLGKEKGIQGHINSCYMDATLFAMFAFSYVFDFILYRKSGKEDASYNKVQRCLHHKIVNPLRINGYVEQQSIMELRRCLDELGDAGGFLDKEKDPEEFIALLFEKVLQVDPFIKLSLQNQPEIGLHLYQIIADVNPLNPQPSIQFLLEMSFLSGKAQLLQIPSVMIVQVPRSGADKIFNRIQIYSTIDISPFLQDAEHLCIICGRKSCCYCPECVCEFGLDKVYTFLCEKCWDAVHSHRKRLNHKPVTVNSSSTVPLKLTTMELFAVVCIKTSHYISFVKCGEGNESSWVFFDSMADRRGDADGYNIPEVVEVPELNELLNATPLRISKINKDDCALRLYEDASLCFYRNTQMSMYT